MMRREKRVVLLAQNYELVYFYFMKMINVVTRNLLHLLSGILRIFFDSELRQDAVLARLLHQNLDKKTILE
jgi:hypothetical protein